MKLYYDRVLVLLVLSTLTLSALALSSAQGPRAQTFEISPITFDPNPGFTCGDTNINFTVTNRMATVVDSIIVNVSAKSSVGSQQWGTNITTLAANQSKAMSFLWKSPAAGTYDIAIRVVGMGQIVITTTTYTVSVCGPHIAFGAVTFVPGAGPVCVNGTVSIDVINDGHAKANDTSVFVSAYGPFPATTRIPIGSTTVPSIGVGASVKVDMLWTPLPVPGVYSLEVLTIDALGQVASSTTYVTVPVCPVYDVRLSDITFDPYPGQWGKDAAINITVLNAGTQTATSVTVSLSVSGPANYTFDSQTIPVLAPGARVKVKFPWLHTLPSGRYTVQYYESSLEFPQTSASTTYDYLAPSSPGGGVTNQTRPSNVVLSSLMLDPAPGLEGKDVTCSFTVTNTGGATSGNLRMSLSAIGPTDYMIGNVSSSALAPGRSANLTLVWKAPIMAGPYTVYVFITSSDGTQSSGSTFFIQLGSHTTGPVLQNGTYYYYYYYYGQPVNGTIKIEPKTLNITLKTNNTTGTKTTDMAVAGALGAGLGGLISVGGILGVLAIQKGAGPSSSKRFNSDPYVEDTQRAASSGGGGRGSMQGSKFAIKENGLPKHKPSKDLDNRGSQQDSDFAIKENGVKSSSTRGSLQSASDEREDYTGKATGRLRESPTKASTGKTSLRESPSRPRDSSSGQATGKRSGEPLDDDSDDDGTPELKSKKGYDYYQAKSDMNASQGLRESPTKASIGKTSLRESPSKSQLRESPSKATGIRESPTEPSQGSEERSTSPQGDLDGDRTADVKVPRDPSHGQASGRESSAPSVSEITTARDQATGKATGRFRESPTSASTGQTTVRESPTKSTLRESPSKASTGDASVRESPTLPSRDQASGQASGKRFGIGSSQPDSPLGKVQEGLDEKSQLSDTFEKGDKPTQEQGRASNATKRSIRASDQKGSDQGDD